MGAPQSQSETWHGLKGEKKAGHRDLGPWPAFFNVPFLSCQWRALAPSPFLPPPECLGVSASLPVLTKRQDVFRDPSAKKRNCPSCQSWRLLLTGEET